MVIIISKLLNFQHACHNNILKKRYRTNVDAIKIKIRK